MWAPEPIKPITRAIQHSHRSSDNVHNTQQDRIKLCAPAFATHRTSERPHLAAQKINLMRLLSLVLLALALCVASAEGGWWTWSSLECHAKPPGLRVTSRQRGSNHDHVVIVTFGGACAACCALLGACQPVAASAQRSADAAVGCVQFWGLSSLPHHIDTAGELQSVLTVLQDRHSLRVCLPRRCDAWPFASCTTA